jgi:hypothetical protein
MLRKNNPVWSENFSKMFPSWQNFFDWLVRVEYPLPLLGAGGSLPADLQFSRQSFIDWYDAVGHIVRQGTDIRSMSIEQVAQAVHDWHEEMAAKGEGNEYKEGATNIVYGPKWENPAFNGWTIRKVITKNDLEVEGNRMDHCVGGSEYASESGRSIIYSLRDSKNEPHATLDDRPKQNSENMDFFQIKGRSNSEPKKEYKEMIKEWFKSLMKSGKKVEAGEDEDVNDRIYEAAESFKYSHRPDNDWLDKLLFDENEYGIPTANSNYSFSSAYDNILRGFKNNNNNYYGAMKYAAEPLVRLAIEQDSRTANEYDKKFTYTYVQKLQYGSEDTNTRKNPDAYDKKIAEEQAVKEIEVLWKRNSEIESIANQVQENSEKMFDNNIDYYPVMPDENDFEDPEDYKRAYKEYENNVEYIDEETRSKLPYAFDDDLMEELTKQLESNSIPLRPWMRDSTIWYNSKNKEQKDREREAIGRR